MVLLDIGWNVCPSGHLSYITQPELFKTLLESHLRMERCADENGGRSCKTNGVRHRNVRVMKPREPNIEIRLWGVLRLTGVGLKRFRKIFPHSNGVRKMDRPSEIPARWQENDRRRDGTGSLGEEPLTRMELKPKRKTTGSYAGPMHLRRKHRWHKGC